MKSFLIHPPLPSSLKCLEVLRVLSGGKVHGPLDLLKRHSVSLNLMTESLRSCVYVSLCVCVCMGADTGLFVL